jgi:hypothetical protein
MEFSIPASRFDRLEGASLRTRTASESLTPFPDRICDACSSCLAIYDYDRQLRTIRYVGNLYDFDRIANVVN